MLSGSRKRLSKFEDIGLILLRKAGLELAMAFLRADQATPSHAPAGRLEEQRAYPGVQSIARPWRLVAGTGKKWRRKNGELMPLPAMPPLSDPRSRSHAYG
jgi:hypothetical protein